MSNVDRAYFVNQAYGASVGTYTGNTGMGQPYNIGLTDQADKSGIICEADANIVLVIKY